MTIEEAYRDMREWLKGRQFAAETIYTPTFGFHLKVELDDDRSYLVIHPEETDHGKGWDVIAADTGEVVKSAVTQARVRRFVDTVALARAIWRFTPTPPMGLKLPVAVG